ncbi:hypothetical protein ASPBRDRAFT_35837 [Aspergillus brasiliensis CBS 101740]|uniref:Aminoglycoside phosphotransferase domain-containing protein n=1 Tax=Aspergillus brasiliensis (strain CBS 101740 / IMI 381727 / IBT 21946) TaxID=767769 RepID=A0A1L9U1N7_ASPBC|nr:hypothetical protein ASPBRDRAFT_35837 [Aspergillus brasiliensis CBS 101740]
MTPSNACFFCGWSQACQHDGRYRGHVNSFFQEEVMSFGPGTVLKVQDNNLPTDEVSNIRLVQEQTSIPVPKILEDREEEDQRLVLMERIPGEPLSTVWPSLSFEQRESIAKQTAEYLLELREIQSNRMQSLGGGPVFNNSLFAYGDDSYPRGPFASDDELWVEMERELHESVPEAVREQLRSRMPQAKPYTFTHGDLTYSNIMVKDGCVTGIINWEMAAYMPVWWESVRASISEHGDEDEDWKIFLEEYMPDYSAAYEFWRDYLYLCLDPSQVEALEQAEREALMDGS